MRKMVCILIVCFIIISVLLGSGILQKLGLRGNNDELSPVSSIVMTEDQASQLNDKVPVRLYFADKENHKLRIEIRYIPMGEARKSVNNLAAIIIDELIKGPVKKSLLNPTIPSGTKRNGTVKIEAGVATVDLSKEFVENHTGDKSLEQITIFSIVNSLTELKEIQKVKFTIDGQSRENFKGNFKFDMPFPRAAALMSREAPVSNIFDANNMEDQGVSNIEGSPAEGILKDETVFNQDNVVSNPGVFENGQSTYLEILK